MIKPFCNVQKLFIRLNITTKQQLHTPSIHQYYVHTFQWWILINQWLNNNAFKKTVYSPICPTDFQLMTSTMLHTYCINSYSQLLLRACLSGGNSFEAEWWRQKKSILRARGLTLTHASTEVDILNVQIYELYQSDIQPQRTKKNFFQSWQELI